MGDGWLVVVDDTIFSVLDLIVGHSAFLAFVSFCTVVSFIRGLLLVGHFLCHAYLGVGDVGFI